MNNAPKTPQIENESQHNNSWHKKGLAIAASALLVLGLAGCNNSQTETANSDQSKIEQLGEANQKAEEQYVEQQDQEREAQAELPRIDYGKLDAVNIDQAASSSSREVSNHIEEIHDKYPQAYIKWSSFCLDQDAKNERFNCHGSRTLDTFINLNSEETAQKYLIEQARNLGYTINDETFEPVMLKIDNMPVFEAYKRLKGSFNIHGQEAQIEIFYNPNALYATITNSNGAKLLTERVESAEVNDYAWDFVAQEYAK